MGARIPLCNWLGLCLKHQLPFTLGRRGVTVVAEEEEEEVLEG